MPAVRHDVYRFIQFADNQFQPYDRKSLLKFPHCLCHEHTDLQLLSVNSQISGRCLGSLHQILDQLLQFGRLPLKYFEVLCRLVIVKLLLREQIHIVDDGCERRLDIVGHVRDQFRLEALALHALVDRPGHALADLIQILPVLFAVPEHLFCIDLVREIPLRHTLPRSLQFTDLNDDHTQYCTDSQAPAQIKNERGITRVKDSYEKQVDDRNYPDKKDHFP